MMGWIDKGLYPLDSGPGVSPATNKIKGRVAGNPPLDWGWVKYEVIS